MHHLITETPVPFGAEIPIDPAVLGTLNGWQVPKYPRQSKKFRAQVEKLCEQLERPLSVKVKNIKLTDDPEAAEQSRENARYWLEFVRSILVYFEKDGITIERIQRQVRRHVPHLASRLRRAVELARSSLVESEQSLLFLLDEPVDDEWLPDPALPGSFDRNADSIPLDSV